jgi:chromosome partitioning protein
MAMEMKMNKQTEKIIAICNQKGGVGKSVTAVNLGVGLANEGKRVLITDLDAQGDCTASLGWQNHDNIHYTIATLMSEVMMDEPLSYESTILKHGEGIDLIPSNIELSGVETQLVNAMSREFVLGEVLNPLRKDYDYIVIDCPPTLGMITINALAAADSVIIPVQAQYLPAKGMTQLVKTVNKVSRQINTRLKIDGVLLTMADMRTNMTKTTAKVIREGYGNAIKVFDTEIPYSVKAAEMTAAGQSIYAYDRGSKVAAAYEAFTKEVIRLGERDKDEPALSR